MSETKKRVLISFRGLTHAGYAILNEVGSLVSVLTDCKEDMTEKNCVVEEITTPTKLLKATCPACQPPKGAIHWFAEVRPSKISVEGGPLMIDGWEVLTGKRGEPVKGVFQFFEKKAAEAFADGYLRRVYIRLGRCYECKGVLGPRKMVKGKMSIPCLSCGGTWDISGPLPEYTRGIAS